MAKSDPSARPTESEQLILRVLWEHGPSTVRQVMEALTGEREMGYTTVLKFLQIMREKGLVTADAREKTHVFRAAVPADRTRKRLVADLADRLFGGSAAALALHALGSKKPTRDEISALRQLLDDLDPPSA